MKTFFVMFFLVLLGGAPPVSAQGDPSMEALLEQVGTETRRFDNSPVEPSSVNAVNLRVHWRLWKRVFAEQKAGTNELESLADDGWSVGWASQPTYAMAVAALAPSIDDHEESMAAFEAAERLAPQLPYPYLLHASHALQTKPDDLPTWVRAWGEGARAGVKWPDTAFPWALKLLVYLLLALVAGSLVFLVGQLLRNFGIVAYDLARLMPKSVSSNQTAMLFLALVVVPGFVFQSPLLSVLITLALVSFVQRPNERVVSILVFTLIASLSYADALLVRLSSYPDSLTQKMVHAQWIHCAIGCQEEMNDLAVQRPENPYVRYTTLLAAYRDGGDVNMKRILEESPSIEWPAELVGYARNLEGAAYISQGKSKKAIEALGIAKDQIRNEAAPPFNLMRAYQMANDAEAASSALEEASARDLDVVTRFLGLQRRDTNSFVIVPAVPLELFLKYHIQKIAPPDGAPSPIEPYWELLAGDVLPLDSSRLIGLAGIALVLLGFGLRRRTSTPCPRCGSARNPADASRTANHAYCYPCYSTFITGAQLDYDARVHNEKVLGRRESMQRLLRRFGGLVVPGLGYHVAGFAGAGFATTVVVGFSALLIFRPLGIVRVPQELVATNWTGQVSFAWIALSICVFMLLNIALRGIEPVGATGRD